jgi:dihydrolipoamide dehydrogenase
VIGRLSERPVHVPLDAIPVFVGGAGGCGWSGLTEHGARERGHALRVGRAQLPGRGALPPGFVKLVADRSSNRVLGVHVVGAQAREAVALGALAVEAGLSRLDLAALAFAEGSPADALCRAAQRADDE